MREHRTTSRWFDRNAKSVPDSIPPPLGGEHHREWELVNTTIVHDDVEYDKVNNTMLIAWTWVRDNRPRAVVPKTWMPSDET